MWLRYRLLSYKASRLWLSIKKVLPITPCKLTDIAYYWVTGVLLALGIGIGVMFLNSGTSITVTLTM